MGLSVNRSRCQLIRNSTDSSCPIHILVLGLLFQNFDEVTNIKVLDIQPLCMHALTFEAV